MKAIKILFLIAFTIIISSSIYLKYYGDSVILEVKLDPGSSPIDVFNPLYVESLKSNGNNTYTVILSDRSRGILDINKIIHIKKIDDN